MGATRIGNHAFHDDMCETAWLGDLPVAVLSPAGKFYIGAPHQITGAGGAVVWLWHPDPFGNGDPIDTKGTAGEHYPLRAVVLDWTKKITGALS